MVRADERAGRESGATLGKLRVLFLCTGNSCRSQMAEGWARALKGSEVWAASAGTEPQGLNPLAVRVMKEAGVDISGGKSKKPEEAAREMEGGAFDVVVTVCDSAYETCPIAPGVGSSAERKVGVGGARVVHKPFEDPPRLAKGARSEEEALGHYRRVRDEIRAFVETLPGSVLGG